MGAIERSGYRFIPEYSVIGKNGAIHVYYQDQFLDEIQFIFSGGQTMYAIINGHELPEPVIKKRVYI
ncbi:DUF5370 family protein [Bacillota bacterium Lsc_1132]